MEPAYEGAGTEAGLLIWRIENFEVVPYPKEKHGQFYEGDSYIILYTQDNHGSKSWDVFFWLGSQTTQDEAGSAAIKAVELDDHLGGVPVQYREVQGHESSKFLSRFKNGVRYLKGGVASGFTHVDPDAPYPARLFKVKGRRNVRVRQVDLAVSEMNQGDCFILDAGKKVFVYMGPNSRRIERLKAITAGNAIRDDDHAGSAKIVIIDETATSGEVSDFFEALGGGSPDDIPEDDTTGDDAAFERSAPIVTLHRLHEDELGLIQSDIVSERPLTHELLKKGEEDQDCFLLDTCGAGVFVWLGKNATKKEKVRSVEIATNYLEKQNYPKWTKVDRVIEGAEPTIFKQYFKTWKEPEEKVGLRRQYTQKQLSVSGEPDFNVASLHSDKRKLMQKNSGPAFGFMPDDGSGKIEIFRVEDFELQPVDESIHGFFFGGDSYVIKYTYNDENGGERYIIYFWQGISSSQDEKASSAIHAVRLDNELCGKAVQVRVVQGHEPAHFLRMFKGKMVMFTGGKASGFKNVHDHDTYDADGTRLFQIRGTCDFDTRAEQKPEVTASLNSDDLFLLETPETTYLWLGKGASGDELQFGEKLSEIISPGRDVVQVSEGEEPDEFWTCLGGAGDYQQLRDVDAPLLAPRLFHCRVSPAGAIKVDEIDDFSQEDLNEDDMMVLDTGDEVYIWVGAGASDEEKEKCMSMAEEYVKTDPSDRSLDSTVIMRVSQGEEPVAFTALFPAWNPEMWQIDRPSYDDIKAQVQEANEGIED